MSYVSLEEVKSFTLTISTGTSPGKLTDAQLQNFIDIISGEIEDFITGLGYTAPVTANNYLKKMALYGASAMFLAAYDKTVSSGNEQRDYRRDEYNRMLEELRNHPEHAGITVSTGQGVTSGNDYTDSFGGYDEDVNGNEFYSFTKNGTDW